MAFLDLNTKILIKPDYINGHLVIANNINNPEFATRLYEMCPSYFDLRNHINDDFLFVPLNGEISNVYESFINIADYINWLLKEVFTKSLLINTELSNRKKKKEIVTAAMIHETANQMKINFSTFASLTNNSYRYIIIGLNTNVSFCDNMYHIVGDTNDPKFVKSFMNIEFDNKKHYDILGPMLEEYGFNKISQNYYFAELNVFKFKDSYYSKIKELLNEKMQNFLEKKNDNKHIIPEDCDNFGCGIFKDIHCE